MRTPSPWVLPDRPTLLRGLVGAGVTERRVELAVRDGRLVRIRHGVYLGAGRWPEDAGERHLLRAWAEQLVKPGGVVSHRSAARYWELPLPHEDWESEPVWLTFPRGGTSRSLRGPKIEQVIADLADNHISLAEAGFSITTLPRTAVDLARPLPLPESLMVLDAALRRQCSHLMLRVSRRELANPRVVAIAREPFLEVVNVLRGMGGVRRRIAIADPVRESPIESLSFGHMVEAGLPLPICQPPIRTPQGLYFPDFYWEDARVIGESDGRQKYRDSGTIMREKEREQALKDLDFELVRWSGKEIHLTPATVMARIERKLASRR